MLHLALASVVLLASAYQAAQEPALKLGEIRAIYIQDHKESLGSARKLGSCFIEKMKEQGPFTFPEDQRDADALITLVSSIPSGAKRGLLGRSPEVKATITTPSGAVLWTGENKYKKSTTIWGGNTDIECGLANGLVNKLVKAIEKAGTR